MRAISPACSSSPQHLVQAHANAAFPAERLSQLDLIERPIFGRAEQAQDLFAQLLIV